MIATGHDGYEVRLLAARAAFGRRDPNAARAALEAAANIDTERPEAWQGLAEVAERLRDPELRLRALRRLAEIDQHDREASHDLLTMLAERNEWAEVVRYGEMSVFADPLNAGSRRLLAEAYLRADRAREALLEVDAALAAQPEQPGPVHLLRARVLVALRRARGSRGGGASRAGGSLARRAGPRDHPAALSVGRRSVPAGAGRSTIAWMSRPRLTIPTRIFLSFVLVLLAFGVVSAASLIQHQRTAARLRLLHEGYLPLALTIGQAKATQAVFNTLLDRVLQERDPTATRSWLDTARRVRPTTVRRALSGIERAEQLEPPPEDREALAEIRATLERTQGAYAAGEQRFEDLFIALESGQSEQAGRILEDLRLREQHIARHLRVAWGQVQSRIAATSRNAAEQERQSLLTIASLSMLALLLGLVLLWWSQRLLSPLPRLQKRVAAVATGDFAGKVAPARDDEIGQLTLEFERMVDALSARDRDLREAAESLRELQRMQEQIVAGLRAGVVVVGPDGLVRSANRAAGAVLGLPEEAAGEPLADTALLERLPGLREAIERVAGGGERASLAAAPLAPREAGGQQRFLDVLITPFGAGDPEGPRRSVLVVADDVTEELRTKQRLIQTERLAAIGRMAAHVTHEVRNPLSSIGLNVELLEEEIGGAGVEAKALLRAIEREIDRLTAITEEYLRLARLPAPRLEPESLGDIVLEVGRFVAREMETSSVRLRVEVAPDLPLVAADEPQIRQALLNLLRNAREAMSEGGEVGLEARSEAGGVEIRVIDQGPGIPPVERAHIFDLFYSTKERGTGLRPPPHAADRGRARGRIRCDDGRAAAPCSRSGSRPRAWTSRPRATPPPKSDAFAGRGFVLARSPWRRPERTAAAARSSGP
ncbi:MAG: ATP-binding protein [Sandaracinaceae bacterium]|nr:ATP-binding protein [Sandaracinaceae bacterium]